MFRVYLEVWRGSRPTSQVQLIGQCFAIDLAYVCEEFESKEAQAPPGVGNQKGLKIYGWTQRVAYLNVRTGGLFKIFKQLILQCAKKSISLKHRLQKRWTT